MSTLTIKSQNNTKKKPSFKIFDGFYSLVSQYVFNNKGNIHNINGINYLKRYLNDKDVFYDTERNILYIEKNEKPLYRITIEKL